MAHSTRRSGASPRTVTVTFELQSEADAIALAQFVKRVGWQEWRQNAATDDEAYRMKAGFWALQKGLAEAGFAPH